MGHRLGLATKTQIRTWHLYHATVAISTIQYLTLSGNAAIDRYHHNTTFVLGRQTTAKHDSLTAALPRGSMPAGIVFTHWSKRMVFLPHRGDTLLR